jgi:hypothetical protein
VNIINQMLVDTVPQVFGVRVDTLSAVGTAGAVVVALLLGLWVNGLSSWFFRPRLKASLEPKLPDCHVVDATSAYQDSTGQVLVTKVSDQYYCRLRITNGGWFCTSANDVELRLYRLWDVDTTPATEVTFLPLNLNWSHVVTTPLTPERKVITPLIQPRVFRHCDLCYVDSREPKLLNFCAELEPNPIGGVQATKKPPGKYELDLILAGANYTATFVTVSIDFSGNWPKKHDFTTLLAVKVIRQKSGSPTKHPVH